MKYFVLIISSAFLFCISCQPTKKPNKKSITIGAVEKEQSADFLLGKKLFKGKGNCYSCHRLAKKSIGPSVQHIMKIYSEQEGDIIGFLQKKQDPIVDPDNYSVMKTNFAVLEKFTEKELKALELYMQEVSKK